MGQAVSKINPDLIGPRALPRRAIMSQDLLIIEARNYSEGFGVEVGNPHGQTPYGNVIHNSYPYRAKPNAVKYYINFPKKLKYAISVEYAAAQSRPAALYINSQLFLPSTLAKTTGGWKEVSQRWDELGNFQLELGRNELVISSASYFPHIKTIKLERISDDSPVLDPIQDTAIFGETPVIEVTTD